MESQINQKVYYQSQISELERQLKEEKNKNKILTKENANLRASINNLYKQIGDINVYENKIKSLQDQIKQKNIQIQNYQSNFNIQNYQQSQQFNTPITILRPGEKIMTINFVSMGTQEIGHYSLPCKNTDLFIRLEEKLNHDHPDLKNYETYFEVGTRRIKRFKTLDENKIKSNDIISIFINEI